MSKITATNATDGTVTEESINATLSVGDSFRLIGNTTIFWVTQVFLAAGFIPAVVGVSTCGKFRTIPRIADTLAV